MCPFIYRNHLNGLPSFLPSSFITKLYEHPFHILIAPPTSLCNYPIQLLLPSPVAERPVLKHPQFTMVHYSQPQNESNFYL